MSGRAVTGALVSWTVLVVVALVAGEWLLVLGLSATPAVIGTAAAVYVTCRNTDRERRRAALRAQGDGPVVLPVREPRRLGRRAPASGVATPEYVDFVAFMQAAGAGDLADVAGPDVDE